MKVPGWGILVLLLISVAVLVTPIGYWWITWPQRTARRYGELLATGQQHDALVTTAAPAEIILGAPGAPESPSDVLPANITVEPRSIVDVVVGRQRFRINADWCFAVERDRVVANVVTLHP